MRREPYVITGNMRPDEIKKLINRAYDEGYQDGSASLVITSPKKHYETTATDPWRSGEYITVTCNNENVSGGSVTSMSNK